MERYTSCDSSGAWRVHRWRLPCFSLVLGDMEAPNNMSGQCYNECAVDAWVDSSIFRCLRATFLPMLVNEPAEYPEPDEDDPLREALLPEQKRHENALPSAPPPHKPVRFDPSPGQVPYLKWWLTKYFGIMWIYSTCMQKWAMMNRQKCSSNSSIHEIPLYL